MANFATTAGRLDPRALWDLEDEEALAAARTLFKQYSEIESETGEANPAAPDPRGAATFQSS